MFRLIGKFFRSRCFRLLVIVIKGIASAIIVISGYLFLLSVTGKSKSREINEEEEESEVEDFKAEEEPDS